jgi:hypothetical protein
LKLTDTLSQVGDNTNSDVHGKSEERVDPEAKSRPFEKGAGEHSDKNATPFYSRKRQSGKYLNPLS